MASKLRLVFTITIVFLAFYGSAQSTYWQQESYQDQIDHVFSKRFDVKKGKVFTFEEERFKKNLQTVSFAKKSTKVVYFPNELGKMIPFQVFEAPVLSPELSARYPQIKSYSGYALDNSKDKIRFSVSQNGIQSMLVPANGRGNVYMQKGTDGKYLLYTRDSNSTLETELVCTTKNILGKSSDATAFRQPVTGQMLRRFRLAVSATGEYTEFHGGTVADALAAINATVTRVNEVFETDLGVTFELIPNMDSVIFDDPDTDPYSGSSSTVVQSTLTTNIGEANYDLGILFNRIESGADGNAGFIGAVCVDNRKGSAFAAIPNPTGDVFDLDFVAHEIGHQFGANHTWSFEAEGTGAQVEPGSGTTIMGYAGIAGINNVSSNGEDYFHYVSIVQIADYLNTVSCAEIINLTNNPPLVTPAGGFTIPKSTAFVLTGNATDADNDVLTYTWEQIDDGVITQSTFGPNNPSGSNFRSQKPSTSPERYFPKLSNVLLGLLTQTNPGIGTAWETVSDVEREMNFALTVRDNGIGGGQVASDLVNVFVENNAGPFVVTSQTTAVVATAGNVENITWDVANTYVAPINAKMVDILLSIDGGLTFPITLADDVLNDGEHAIVVPGNPTTEARIMVKASDNIFFAVNAVDFSIDETEIVLNFANLSYEVCQPDNLVVPFTYETYLGFAEEVTFSVDTPPVGLDISFSPLTATANDTPIAITFSNTQNLAVGSYPIRVLATSAGASQQVTIDLSVYDTGFTNVVLVAPSDGLAETSTDIPLEWEADFLATSYDVQIATDAAFTNIVDSSNVIANAYIPIGLDNETTYFWRVLPKNSCGEGSFNAPFSYTTIEFNCMNRLATGLPAVISTVGTPTVVSKIAFFEDLQVSDLNVTLELNHTYLEDLTVTLTSPSGTIVTLFSNSCGDLKNVNAVFDDSAPSFVCNGDPAIEGMVKPLGSLSSFEGESIMGEWVLSIVDNAPADGGSLISFSLEVCVEGDFRPDDDQDGVFDDGPDLCLGTPIGTQVDSSGCPIFKLPSDTFSIKAQSESCRNNNDGELEITANQALDYSISITGNATNISAAFITTYTTTGLMAGIYAICIIAADGTMTYEEQCFEVEISQPDALGVSSKVSLDGRQIELELEGASLYNIELNGIVTQTTASKISLDLKDGGNSLKVFTNLACQGVYEERFFASDAPVVYPNPFTDFVRVVFRGNVKSVNVAIHSTDGRLIQSKEYEVNGAEMEIDLSQLSTGLYHLRFEGENIKETAKLIKR